MCAETELCVCATPYYRYNGAETICLRYIFSRDAWLNNFTIAPFSPRGEISSGKKIAENTPHFTGLLLVPHTLVLTSITWWCWTGKKSQTMSGCLNVE